MKIFSQGIIEAVSNCLRFDNPQVIALSLEAIAFLINLGKEFSKKDVNNTNINKNNINPVLIQLELNGMIDVIEKLQFHPSELIYKKVILTY